MGLFSRLRSSAYDDELELRHTDTDPSAYPIDYQLDAVQWHVEHGLADAESVPAVYAAVDLLASSGARLPTVTSSRLSERPDVFSTRYEFLFESIWSLAMRGNAYWLAPMMSDLLEGSPEVLHLFDPERHPFPDRPPRAVRLVEYRYDFTDRETRERTGRWWNRRTGHSGHPVRA